MEIKVTKRLNTPKIQEIREFEQINDIKMPHDFLNFLMEYNPIFLSSNVYGLDDRIFYIDRFYPFDKFYELSIQSIFSALKEHLGNHYFAFANDPGDWQYLISLKNNTYGQIFLCRMDEVISDSLIKVADNFEEFINGLKTSDEF